MEKLNPFLKGVTILLCGLILSLSSSLSLNILIIVMCIVLMLFFSNAKVLLVAKIMIPAIIAAASMFFTGLLFTDSIGLDPELVKVINNLNIEVVSYSIISIYNALQLATRVLAYALLGVIFALTTDGEEFVKSLMHQCKLAPKYAYGVLAAFHLLPNIKEELKTTKLAFKVRGITTSPFSLKPVFTLLVNTIHWSENVAMAMESKGFDGEGERSFYSVTYIKWFDWIFMLAMIVVMTFGVQMLP